VPSARAVSWSLSEAGATISSIAAFFLQHPRRHAQSSSFAPVQAPM